MKQLVLLLGVLLLLTACQSMYPDEYLSVEEHQAPFAYRETTEVPTVETEPAPQMKKVSRASDIREGIQELISQGEEFGQFQLAGYLGDVESDMRNMLSSLLSDSPKYPYALDSFDWSVSRAEAGRVVTVRMQLRLTPQEIQAIKTRLFPEPAMSDIYKALRQQLSSFTVQVSGYRETDLVALLEDYILQHPDQIVEAPGVSAAVYPDRGNVRVLELHFVYPTDRDTLREHTEETNAYLRLISNQMRTAVSPTEMIETIYKNLVPGIGYRSEEEATVYSQVVQKAGCSRTMASVVNYLCGSAAECEIVVGERNGEKWYWNRLLTDGVWSYVDLHAAALNGEAPLLRTAAEMEGYLWDAERYPEREVEPPAEPSDAPEQTDSAQTTEASEEP